MFKILVQLLGFCDSYQSPSQFKLRKTRCSEDIIEQILLPSKHVFEG